MSGFSRNDPNIAMLEHVAVRLGVELCRRVVFVGGAAAGRFQVPTATLG